MQFLVVNRSSVIVVVEVLSCCVFVSSVRANTVKQWILYQTCTGPDVTIIG